MASATRTLRELAVSRLRALFLPADFQHMMQKLDAHDAARTAAKSRCGVRGCVSPSVLDGFCRGHFEDAHAEYSLMRSLTGCVANSRPAAAAV